MRSRQLIFATILAASLACNLAGTPASQGPAPTATPAVQASIPISATPIQLLIPPGLATGATAETIDVVTENTGAPWDVAPAHLQLTLQGYSIEITSHVPQIFVYPAQQYAGLHPSAGGEPQAPAGCPIGSGSRLRQQHPAACAFLQRRGGVRRGGEGDKFFRRLRMRFVTQYAVRVFRPLITAACSITLKA